MSFTEVQQKLFNSNLVLRFLKAVDRNERLFNEFQVSENQKETTLLPYDVTKPSANTKRRNRCGQFCLDTETEHGFCQRCSSHQRTDVSNSVGRLRVSSGRSPNRSLTQPAPHSACLRQVR